ncbi:NUDIX domain-containing protein [Paracoccus sp. ME4]|uniref:NUDIX domain-containing protein n=1 Tax=Paracoccus sp. ME4 TaxID=3138066 RepID=UPI00398B417D
MIVLVGVLTDPGMLAALDVTGTAVTVAGRLSGGARAGLDRDGWPILRDGAGQIAGIATAMTPALRRYADVMGLEPVAWNGVSLLGVGLHGIGGEDATAQPALAAQIAAEILDAAPDIEADLLARRLPMIGIWAASRLRARAMPASGQGVVPLRDAGAVRTLRRDQPFAGYFAVERLELTHALHQGGQSGPMTREAFLMGDAAVLLPWDPVRDRVLVIEQFRLAPALRGDPQPWLLEPIAGRVDAGETPEAAILREAREEADLTIDRLIPAFHAYPSPGAVCEFLYQYVGIADLPDGRAGIHGLDGEAEDIRGHLMARSDLSAMVDAGRITNGPLAMLSLWLDARADRLRGEPARG